MFLRRFKGTGPEVIALIFIVTVLVWISPILNPASPSSPGFDVEPMPLFGLLAGITGQNQIVGLLFTILLVLLIAFLLVNFNTSGFFISERTFLPALFYILFSGLFPTEQILNPALPAAIFLILAVRKIMDSYKIQRTAYSFFDAGLLISTGSLFYAGFIWFGLLLIIGIVILRTGNVREIIISLLGLITPWFITFGLYYVTDNDPGSLLSAIKYNFSVPVQDIRLTGVEIAALTGLGIILVISILFLFSVMNTKKIKSRKTFSLLMWAFVISAGMYLFIKGVSVEIFWLAGVPASYLLSHYFVFSKQRLIPEILFSLLFVLVALMQIGRP